MKFSLEFYEEYLEKINQFREINWVKNYIELKKKPNFWTILEYGQVASSRQKSSHEIRYSKMLRWLLDANENHNLGNIFAYKLIKKINNNSDYNNSLEKNKLIKSTNEALQSDIDIFYKDSDQNVCMAIELKQFSSEHESTGYDSQLDKYEDAVKRFIEEKAQDMLAYYIYLTPKKEEPSNENWHAVGYKEIIDIIEEIDDEYVSKSNDIYKTDIQKIIYDFKDDLQRTIDVFEKDISYIKKNFSKKEIEFTDLLADEIIHETESKNIDKLIELDNDNNIDIKEIVLLINEYSYTQDHTPNEGVILLMRKIFNYISEDPDIDLDLKTKLTPQQRKSLINPQFVEEYELDLNELELTQGKGQGIFLYHKLNNRRIYFSGDKDGHVPNDYMSVLKSSKDKEAEDDSIRSEKIRNKMFKVDYDLIIKDKIIINKNEEKIDSLTGKKTYEKTTEIISFEEFMKKYILKEIKVLNDCLNKS